MVSVPPRGSGVGVGGGGVGVGATTGTGSSAQPARRTSSSSVNATLRTNKRPVGMSFIAEDYTIGRRGRPHNDLIGYTHTKQSIKTRRTKVARRMVMRSLVWL